MSATRGTFKELINCVYNFTPAETLPSANAAASVALTLTDKEKTKALNHALESQEKLIKALRALDKRTEFIVKNNSLDSNTEYFITVFIKETGNIILACDKNFHITPHPRNRSPDETKWNLKASSLLCLGYPSAVPTVADGVSSSIDFYAAKKTYKDKTDFIRAMKPLENDTAWQKNADAVIDATTKFYKAGSWTQTKYVGEFNQYLQQASSLLDTDKVDDEAASNLGKAIEALIYISQEHINKIDLKNDKKRKQIFAEIQTLGKATHDFIVSCKNTKEKTKENFIKLKNIYLGDICQIKTLKKDPIFKNIIVAVIGAIIGFFAGLCVGALAGPAAAFTALASGAKGAIIGTAIGSGAGALASHSMFQRCKPATQFNKQVDEVQKQVEKLFDFPVS